MSFPRRWWLGPMVVAMLAAALPAAADDRPAVFVGIPPLGWVVERLAPDLVSVQTLLPPGASPHAYEPTPRQLGDLAGADLYLRIGLPFEDAVLAKVSSVMRELEVVDCSRGVERVAMESRGAHGHDHGPLDPHIWLDPQRMSRVAANAAAALTDLLPERRGDIEARLTALQRELAELDRRVQEVLAPYEGRTIVVLHPAYGYLARRYGLQQLAVEVEGKSPSVRQLAELVERLKDLEVPAIFVQPQFSKTTAQRVADALGCRVVELDPLAADYAANLEVMAERVAAVLGG